MSKPEKELNFGKVKLWYANIVENHLKIEKIHNVEVTCLEYAFDPVHAVLIEGEYISRFGEDKWKSLIKKAEREIRMFYETINLFLISQEKEVAYMFKDHTWKVLPTRSKIRNFLRIKLPLSFIQSDLLTEVINERNIIAFKDCVIDMEKYSAGFRKGEPSDFTTISLDYEISYVSESRKTELQDLINKILPEYNLKEYFLFHLASCLSYGNLDKVFVIWSGIGSNGKSVMEALVEHTLGGYCYKAPTSLFSSRRTQSSNATPEVANLNKYLLSFIQESDEREVANIGTLKELTGNDTIYTRNLYSSPKTIDVRCKFILVTNKIYNLSQADEATWARVRVIPFKSRFTRQKEEVDESRGIYLLDPKFIKEVKYLAPALMQLLLSYYQKYQDRRGLPECREVNVATDELKRNNSPASMYIEEFVIRSPENSVSVQEVYEKFRDYARKNCGVRNTTLANFNIELKKAEMVVHDGQIVGAYLKKQNF